jgi:hypothetical protein
VAVSRTGPSALPPGGQFLSDRRENCSSAPGGCARRDMMGGRSLSATLRARNDRPAMASVHAFDRGAVRASWRTAGAVTRPGTRRSRPAARSWRPAACPLLGLPSRPYLTNPYAFKYKQIDSRAGSPPMPSHVRPASTPWTRMLVVWKGVAPRTSCSSRCDVRSGLVARTRPPASAVRVLRSARSTYASSEHAGESKPRWHVNSRRGDEDELAASNTRPGRLGSSWSPRASDDRHAGLSSRLR